MHYFCAVEIDTLTFHFLSFLILDGFPNATILKLHSIAFLLNLLDILFGLLNLNSIILEMLTIHIDGIGEFSQPIVLETLPIDMLILHLGQDDFSLNTSEDAHVGDQVLLLKL